MGIGTQPNFIDALPNNHGLTLPNKKCRGSLHFNGHLSLLGACLRGRGGMSAEYMSLYSMQKCLACRLIKNFYILQTCLCVQFVSSAKKRHSRENISPILMVSPLTRFFQAHFEVAKWKDHINCGDNALHQMCWGKILHLEVI